MRRVYDSLTGQYDIRLVFLAGLICITTCLISMNLFVHANDAERGFVAWMLVSEDGCRPAGLNSESPSAFAENKSSILRVGA